MVLLPCQLLKLPPFLYDRQLTVGALSAGMEVGNPAPLASLPAPADHLGETARPPWFNAGGGTRVPTAKLVLRKIGPGFQN